MLLRVVVIGAILCSLCTALAAQRLERIDDANLPRFEVVSIKRADPQARSSMVELQPGRFVQQNSDMLAALSVGFGVRLNQMPNRLPDVLAEQYSIDARAPAGATPREIAFMIRALLIDRFKLRYHIETKEQDAYALTVARRDRLGPNLRPSTVDCATRVEAQRRKEGVPPQPVGTKACGIRNGLGTIDFGGQHLSALTQMLSNQTGRQVVDQTGLSGPFDVELHWSLASSGPLRATADGTAPFSDGPSIFTAVEEQLGLNLRPTKAPVDYLIIDHVEWPSEN